MQSNRSVDLEQRIRWGVNSLVGSLDPTQRHMPYWAIRWKGGLASFYHAGAWDWCHDVARVLHGLHSASRHNADETPAKVWEDLAALQLELFDDDDLPGCTHDKSGERFVHLHNIRESSHALGALICRGNEVAAARARLMVQRLLDAMDRHGKIDLTLLPDSVAPYTWQPHMEGRAVDALIRLYQINGDEGCVELASRMTRYALENCFGPEGALLPAAGLHSHSINAMVAGIADLARLTADRALMDQAKMIYRNALPFFHSTFGWSAESLSKPTSVRGESNNTGDLLRAALLLGEAGQPQLYEEAERILRSHLLPSQVLEVDDLPDDESDADGDHRRASRLRGGFSFPTPCDLLAREDENFVTTDVTSGALDGLCAARDHTITQDQHGRRINLLVTTQSHGVRVVSALPGEGRIEVGWEPGQPVFLRVPTWAQQLRVVYDGQEPRTPVCRNSYLLLGSGHEAGAVVVLFEIPETETEEFIYFERFLIRWRGDQIVAMDPPAGLPVFRPMFPRCESG